VRHQPRVRGERGLPRRRVSVRGDAGGQPADSAEHRLRDRGAQQVKRGQARVDRRWPLGQVPCPRRGPLGQWRVLLVVDGQVKLVEQVHRVTPVQFQVAEHDLLPVLERLQVRLVVRVLQWRGRVPCLGQAREPLGHPSRRQVLHDPVVLVPPRLLASERDAEVANGTDAHVQLSHAT
jgi:hypothetical protein